MYFIVLYSCRYRFLGPGTKLEKRLKRGDRPVNELDKAALEHDIFYTKHRDRKTREIGDKILQKKAWKRVISSDAGLGERAAALITTGAMRIKRTLGMGLKAAKKRKTITIKKSVKKRKTITIKKRRLPAAKIKSKGKQLSTFKKVVRKADKYIKKAGNSVDVINAIALALNIILRELNHMKTRANKITIPAKIPIPKSGGALPIIPIVAGMSLLSGAATSVASIAKAVENVISARKSILTGQSNTKQIGNGLYLAPYESAKKKSGRGLYLASSKN